MPPSCWTRAASRCRPSTLGLPGRCRQLHRLGQSLLALPGQLLVHWFFSPSSLHCRLCVVLCSACWLWRAVPGRPRVDVRRRPGRPRLGQPDRESRGSRPDVGGRGDGLAWLERQSVGGLRVPPAHMMDRDQGRSVRSAPDEAREPGGNGPGGLELSPQLADLGVHLREQLPAAALGQLKLQDALDPGQVDAFLLGQPLHLAQDQDVAQRVTAAAARRPAWRDQAEPVVGAQRLRVQAGQLSRHRDDIDGRVIGELELAGHVISFRRPAS